MRLREPCVTGMVVCMGVARIMIQGMGVFAIFASANVTMKAMGLMVVLVCQTICDMLMILMADVLIPEEKYCEMCAMYHIAYDVDMDFDEFIDLPHF